jgi:hypothetical protein
MAALRIGAASATLALLAAPALSDVRAEQRHRGRHDDHLALARRQAAGLTFPAFDPVTSEATNYVALTTRDPFADGDFAAVQTGWNDDAAATQQRARDDPSFRQVYLRYFGGAS